MFRELINKYNINLAFKFGISKITKLITITRITVKKVKIIEYFERISSKEHHRKNEESRFF